MLDHGGAAKAGGEVGHIGSSFLIIEEVARSAELVVTEWRHDVDVLLIILMTRGSGPVLWADSSAADGPPAV
jgi:hypothetical protein